MTTIPAGSPYAAKAEWFTYPGGPAALVTGVTITITRLVDVTVIVGPTSTGVVHVATGLDVYSWTPATDAGGDYALVFNGLDADSESVQASEIVTVGTPDFTYDPSTPVGSIRLMISDVDGNNPVFKDTEIQRFYTLAASNIWLAAAQALDTIAANEVMISKVIRTLDLQVDGSKVAAELRANAATMREQAANYLPDGTLFGAAVIDFQPETWYRGPELAPIELC